MDIVGYSLLTVPWCTGGLVGHTTEVMKIILLIIAPLFQEKSQGLDFVGGIGGSGRKLISNSFTKNVIVEGESSSVVGGFIGTTGV